MKKKTKNLAAQHGEKIIKVSASTVVYAFLILLVATVAFGSILAYGTDTEIGKKIAAKISKVIPFPAAIVSWNHVVYLNGLEENLDSVKLFYQTQSFSNEGLRVDFTTEIGKKRLEIKKREILDKMVEDEIIAVLAKQKGVTVTEAQVDEAVSAKLNEYGTTEQVKADLQKSYGWDLEEFKQAVVLPSMYSQALSERVLREQNNDAQAKMKIEKAQAELDKGQDFSSVVEKYSEGLSKEDGGELGWIKKDQIMPELAEAVFGDAKLESKGVIESAIGFHIVEIEDKKKEGEADVLRLRQIFVAKNTFADWLDSKKKQLNVWIPMNEFVWNKSEGTVEFRDKEMQKFETEQRAKVQGDASLMF
ncbi:MAG: hypothetical protein ACD_56C00112G0002 [uncultured bacterium]|nr:MAG: hypothetical protein ACD_56C00112G0002 [uncultured bacterium]